ncbi:hypothetical protein HBI75_013270 [Parastagonospora nodorum]|nr:hypothetical protein HBI75_013270 [Parastagonospora nodorum]KAH5529666.1 hypothetical protein HBI29_019190 [Parastagonospora nodorum]KAH6062776.1 hypothetical protein HBI67_145940 [Parastagonospora nodorum]KAH6087092.1 hypothetical protein HBI66_041150 [Parastagonospora nodorum]
MFRGSKLLPPHVLGDLARHNRGTTSTTRDDGTLIPPIATPPIAMAPVDRREHRQQRVRGAGPSSVQASFGFNFGALGAKSAKQASLPPQLSSRRTPVRNTPRGANGSAQRHRSASAPRSSSKRAHTPKGQTVTPQVGKRKRGSTVVELSDDNGEEDELSPDREEVVRSIEKSRRVIGTVSPIHEEVDDAIDELSMLGDGGSTVRKSTVDAPAESNGTPMSALAQKRIFSGHTLKRTPIGDKIGSTVATSRQSITRRSKSKSTDPAPETPSVVPNGRPRLSVASRSSAALNTPSAPQAEDESEDELSPAQANGSTPRIVATEEQPETSAQDEGQMEVDELSSPAQPTPGQTTPAGQEAVRANEADLNDSIDQTATELPKRRGRPRKAILADEDESLSAPVPAKTTKRGRPAKAAKATAVATPVSRRLSKKDTIAGAQEDQDQDEELDELSPDKERVVESAKQSAKRRREVLDVSEGEESDAYEEPESEEPEPIPRITKRQSPKGAQHVKPSTEKPPRKRHRFLGPKHAISVMRIKGSSVRGITVADTTRTILEENIDHRLNRMAEKLQTSTDSARRKELRGELNMSLSFKESLNEKLLDLQDANDVLSTNFKKMKLFRRDNAELRKDILAFQNNRQQIALEHDDVQARYDAEKAKADARNKLSEDMFSIEAAIQNGRKKARKEGRENEGPEVPLSMLLGMVGDNVGSSGGGLLGNVKFFNGALERAAGWLEGRA